MGKPSSKLLWYESENSQEKKEIETKVKDDVDFVHVYDQKKFVNLFLQNNWNLVVTTGKRGEEAFKIFKQSNVSINSDIRMIIFCFNFQYHSEWAKDIGNIVFVTTQTVDVEQYIKQIGSFVPRAERFIWREISTIEKVKQIQEQLRDHESSEINYDEMVDYLSIVKSEASYIKNLNEEPIKVFTRCNAFYTHLKKAMQNLESNEKAFQLFCPFIKSVNNAIKSNQEKKAIGEYFAAGNISFSTMEGLFERGSIIYFDYFVSATANIKIIEQMNEINILFVIQIQRRNARTTEFMKEDFEFIQIQNYPLKMSQISVFPNENEIIFPFPTSFRVLGKVHKPTPNLPINQVMLEYLCEFN